MFCASWPITIIMLISPCVQCEHKSAKILHWWRIYVYCCLFLSIYWTIVLTVCCWRYASFFSIATSSSQCPRVHFWCFPLSAPWCPLGWSNLTSTCQVFSRDMVSRYHLLRVLTTILCIWVITYVRTRLRANNRYDVGMGMGRWRRLHSATNRVRILILWCAWN